MIGQSQIQRRMSEAQNIERVRELCAENPELLRSELADRLCDEFGFVDRRARRQRSGCLKALGVLERRGLLTLPAPRSRPGPSQPRRLESSVPAPEDVPEKVGEVRGLELVLVETEAQMRLWNSLLLDEHPRGAGPLVGRQLRYLLGSEHGWLGALGFASAALHLEARDRWIGWDWATRRSHLDMVVGMSRFLIRSSVRCKNLASRVLGLAMKKMPRDFEAAYGYRPLVVETFIDTEKFSGTCNRAANWTRVGSTQGRGRQDRDQNQDKSIKDVYVYVLDEAFRSRFGLSPFAGHGPLPLDTELDGPWTEREFGGAPLGDARLSQRLVQSATVMASGPMRSFPGAAKGDQAVIKGHYRLLDKPDDSAVTMENILLPHREQTQRRMKAEKTALCIHDGTDINLNGAAQSTGLGVIGTNQTGAQSRGLHLHSTLCVTDEGLPLGVLGARCDAPVCRTDEEKAAPGKVPLEERKTYPWILALRDCESVAADMPHTRLVQVMDREADFFELFDEWRAGDRRTELLVRAKHNRRTASPGAKLFDRVKASEARLQFELSINRQSARPKKSKQKARAARSGRNAEMTLRYQPVELRPPQDLQHREPISLWIVHILEEHPPVGEKAVEWFLLTTMEVTSTDLARRLLHWYGLRWRIEDWHRVLKSGCGIEKLRNETGERIKRAVAIYMVVAWHVMLMTLLGREVPDLPAEVLFTDLELKFLAAFTKSRRNLKPPQNLGDAVRLVGRMGGHMGRKRDPPPGHQVLWIGYMMLGYMAAGYLLGCQESDPDPD